MSDVRLMLGDCLDVLPTLGEGSVHCCVTSPPYYGLRDYSCDGQIGLEESVEEYVAKMVDVFREVRRVLRDDGTLWLNLGDSYSGGGGYSPDAPSNQPEVAMARRAPFNQAGRRNDGGSREYKGRQPTPGLKPKDLIGIPWRVAFALQADGWYLRSDIIWHKPNPMPESVRDRPTKAHEYLFLLSKSATYFYDADAVREPQSEGTFKRFGKDGRRTGRGPKQTDSPNGLIRDKASYDALILPNGRNRRSVWTVATKPMKMAHFATFPPKLIEPCILAGTSEAGCCPECGKPWERVVERQRVGDSRRLGIREDHSHANGSMGRPASTEEIARRNAARRDLGFSPACSCVAREGRYWCEDCCITADIADLISGCPKCGETMTPAPHEPTPCTALDPFAGAFTTGVVAKQHGRCFIGIELNPAYLEMGRDRLANTPSPLPGMLGPSVATLAQADEVA